MNTFFHFVMLQYTFSTDWRECVAGSLYTQHSHWSDGAPFMGKQRKIRLERVSPPNHFSNLHVHVHFRGKLKSLRQ